MTTNLHSRLPSARTRIRLYNRTLLVILLVFELFQFASSRDGLMMLFGDRTWAVTLAFALVAVDFAGFAKLYSPELRAMKEAFWTLAAAWLVSAFFDTFLTWYVIATTMSGNLDHVLVQSGTVSAAAMSKWIPLFISLLVWFIQVLLVARLTLSIGGSDE